MGTTLVSTILSPSYKSQGRHVTASARQCEIGAAFLPLLLEKTVMGLEHKGGVNHLALTRTHTALLSAYFYHQFHHKGGNYAHFSAQPQLPEYQMEVYQKLCAAAVRGSPLEHQARIQTRKTFIPDLPCLLHAS